jgi:hypothetical protein
MPGLVHSRWRWRERYRRLVLLSIPLGILIGAMPTIMAARRLGVHAVTREDLIASAALALIAAIVLWLAVELTARLHLGRGWRVGE